MSNQNKHEHILLETADSVLEFDLATGQLVGLRPHAAPQVEFIASHELHPVFVIQYLDDNRVYRRLDSFDATKVDIQHQHTADGQVLKMHFSNIGQLPLHLTATVRASKTERLSRWSLSLSNNAGLEVVDVQFPFIVASHTPSGAPAGEAVLLPHVGGKLITGAQLDALANDTPEAWEFRPEIGDTEHYPGSIFAQFIAYYNDAAGLYIACDDTQGNIKLINVLRRPAGLRLGMAHVGDWPTDDTRDLEYDVLVGVFTGDWYVPAEMYRSWSLKQKWATPLHQRNDIPAWLADAGPYITLRMQGERDESPAFPIEQFLPYEKMIPLLEKVAERVQSPLVPVIMAWEHPGPWIYPDCFPPIGGDESVTRFAEMARERGWHVGSFCNGTRWVTGHMEKGYDGRAYLEEHDGLASVCRTNTGEPWSEIWDDNWRPSYATCMGTEQTRRLAVDFVKRLLGWGLESIQFFDQNFGAATFPCFSPDHDHPPVPGKWMAHRMADVISRFIEEAHAAGQDDAIQSAEDPCNEYCLPLFQQCDVRVSPPSSMGEPTFVPIYHYLFGDCIVMQGMMGYGPDPYHLVTRNALSGVLGEIPGAIMIDDGTLLNKDSNVLLSGCWADWHPPVGSNDDALEMIRSVTAIRRGPGRDFLVYGRMQPPARIDSIETIRWQYDQRHCESPALFHAAWQSPTDVFAIVMANWTTEPQTITIIDPRLGKCATVHIAAQMLDSEVIDIGDEGATVTLPPLSCVLIIAMPNADCP